MLQLPQVIGHRGAMAYAPENTLASFREARRRGARWVEIDVKLTADAVPILMHDASLKRTMGIDRRVAETPRAAPLGFAERGQRVLRCVGHRAAMTDHLRQLQHSPIQRLLGFARMMLQ